MKLLLSYGADVNLSHYGRSPLGLAAGLGDRGLELAKLLLPYGLALYIAPRTSSRKTLYIMRWIQPSRPCNSQNSAPSWGEH